MTFIFFHLKNCSHCEEAEKLVREFQGVTYVEGDEENPLIREFNIKKFPTLIVQGENAGDFVKYEGALEIENFCKNLENYKGF